MSNIANLFNPQIIQMLKSGNPQQIAMNFLQQNSNNNPMLQNVMEMMNSGNSNGIEQIARNLCKSRGIDADQLLGQVQEQFK